MDFKRLSDEDQQKLNETLDSLSPLLHEEVGEQAKKAVFSWLMKYDMPKEPIDMWRAIQASFLGGITWAAAVGFVTLEDKAVKTADEREAWEAEKRAAEEARANDPWAQLEAQLGQQVVSATGPNGYL